MAKKIANRGQAEVLKEREHYERDSLYHIHRNSKAPFTLGPSWLSCIERCP